MITLTLSQIRLAVESGALERMAQQKLPVKMAYWIAKMLPAIEREFNAVETLRTSLVQELGAQDEDTGIWNVTLENMPEFTRRYSELLSESVEIEGRAYALDELPATLELTPLELRALDWLIVGELPAQPSNVAPIEEARAASAGKG